MTVEQRLLCTSVQAVLSIVASTKKYLPIGLLIFLGCLLGYLLILYSYETDEYCNSPGSEEDRSDFTNNTLARCRSAGQQRVTKTVRRIPTFNKSVKADSYMARARARAPIENFKSQ